MEYLDNDNKAVVGYELAFMARCQELIYENEKAIASAPSRSGDSEEYLAGILDPDEELPF